MAWGVAGDSKTWSPLLLSPVPLPFVVVVVVVAAVDPSRSAPAPAPFLAFKRLKPTVRADSCAAVVWSCSGPCCWWQLLLGPEWLLVAVEWPQFWLPPVGPWGDVPG